MKKAWKRVKRRTIIFSQVKLALISDRANRSKVNNTTATFLRSLLDKSDIVDTCFQALLIWLSFNVWIEG